MAIKASALAIAALRPKARDYEVSIVGHPGLVVTVYPSGVRVFTLRYRQDGILRRVNLDTDRLKKASAAWLEHREALRGGEDPSAQRKHALAEKQRARQAERLSPTIAQLCDRYIEEHAKRNKRSWPTDQRIIDSRVVPEWGKLLAKDIRRADVRELIDRIATVEEKPIRANRVLALVRKVFSFGLHIEVLEHHPCLRMKNPGAENVSDRHLSRGEIGAVWKSIPGMPAAGANVLRLQLLLGTSVGETVAARWEHVDFDERTLLIPAGHAKNKCELLLPLAPEAIAILESLSHDGDHLFPSKAAADGHLTANVISVWLRDALVSVEAPLFTSHALRRTVETGLARLRYPRELRDRVLNHVDASVGARHYNRHDYLEEKRAALEHWGREVVSIAQGREGAEVVALGSRKAG